MNRRQRMVPKTTQENLSGDLEILDAAIEAVNAKRKSKS